MRGFCPRGRRRSAAMARPKKYPDELIQRGVRLAREGERPIAHIAHDLGIHPETLRKRVRQAEADSGARPGLLSSQEREEIRRLRRENYELRRANEILKSASVFSPRSSTQTDRSERVHRRCIASASGSSRSAGSWACRRPPITTAPAGRPPRGRLRTSGCSGGSASCTPPTTTPTATGGCGRHCSEPGSRSRAALCSG
jgi:transposase